MVVLVEEEVLKTVLRTGSTFSRSKGAWKRARLQPWVCKSLPMVEPMPPVVCVTWVRETLGWMGALLGE